MVIQPIANQNEAPGYTLHLFNQSFGDRPVQNLIREVAIVPFPLNFIKDLGISSDGDTEGSSSEVIPIQNSSHPAEFIYTVGVSSEVIPKTVNLYQTRSPYWKAIEVSQSNLQLPLWKLIFKLPFIYFFSPNAKYLLLDTNYWFNSWLVPPGNHNLAIFYLPQYLEFLGFLLLPIPP